MTRTEVYDMIEGPPTKSTSDVELADLIQMRTVARLRQSYRYALGYARFDVCVVLTWSRRVMVQRCAVAASRTGCHRRPIQHDHVSNCGRFVTI